MQVNMLPIGFRRNRLLMQCATLWGAATVTATLFVLIAYSPSLIRFYRSYTEVASLQRDMAPVQSLLSEERRLVKIAESNRSKMGQLQSMLPESRIPALLGMIGKACAADEIRVWLHEIVVTPELPS